MSRAVWDWHTRRGCAWQLPALPWQTYLQYLQANVDGGWYDFLNVGLLGYVSCGDGCRSWASPIVVTRPGLA